MTIAKKMKRMSPNQLTTQKLRIMKSLPGKNVVASPNPIMRTLPSRSANNRRNRIKRLKIKLTSKKTRKRSSKDKMNS